MLVRGRQIAKFPKLPYALTSFSRVKVLFKNKFVVGLNPSKDAFFQDQSLVFSCLKESAWVSSWVLDFICFGNQFFNNPWNISSYPLKEVCLHLLENKAVVVLYRSFIWNFENLTTPTNGNPVLYKVN